MHNNEISSISFGIQELISDRCIRKCAMTSALVVMEWERGRIFCTDKWG